MAMNNPTQRLAVEEAAFKALIMEGPKPTGPLTLADVTLTLPFNTKKAPTWKIVATAMRSTQKKWHWFVNAGKTNKENNTHLGTLLYLPREIRDLVYSQVLDNHFEETILDIEDIIQDKNSMPQGQSVDGLWRRDLHYQVSCPSPYRPKLRRNSDVFSGLSYYPHWDHRNSPAGIPISMRLSSPTLRNEIDEIFLSRSTFKFDCPKALAEFLSKLSPTQQSYLRRLTLELLSYHYCYKQMADWKSWMAVFAPQQSLNLESLKVIHVEVGNRAHPRPRGGRARHWNDYRGVWFGGERTKITRITEVADLLDVITKQIKRRIPDISIAMQDQTYFLDEDRAILSSVLSEIE